ncbi:hypothetical protein P3X46_034547, partial [Hevea brasiliensis]
MKLARIFAISCRSVNKIITGSYLGLPTAIGRNKQEVFQFVKDKFWRRINSWKNKALSRAGKEILVKTVLQSLPNYVMNLFLLPKGICDDLQQIMARFWWGTKVDGSRSLHWLGWDRLACHKHFGGLSFKKIRQFNIAMLGRMGWHLYMNSNSLASRILKAKYYPNVSFLEAPIGNNPSYVWRSIRESQSLICDGIENLFSIPLRRSSSIDLQFWKHDKRGDYSISGKLWSISSTKNRNFLWRLCIGSLPTRSRLCSRHNGTMKKPGPNWVKLNVDIATNVNSGWTGIGMVVRNEMGSFVACKISRMVGLFSPTIAEIMG